MDRAMRPSSLTRISSPSGFSTMIASPDVALAKNVTVAGFSHGPYPRQSAWKKVDFGPRAGGSAIREEQNVVEMRLRRLDHCLQLRAEGVVVRPSRALKSPGLPQKLRLQRFQHLLRGRVR
eukprot:scaffold565_cov379-Pinguiococcus_pyrenoidosus.AAC.26